MRTITKFYTAKHDRVFKTVFCDSDDLGLLQEFLHRILEIPIDSIELIQPELPVRNTFERVKTVDVLVKTEGKYIHIEINTGFNQYLHCRNFNYFTTYYNIHTKRGEEYDIDTEFIHLDFTYGLSNQYDIKTEYEIYSQDKQLSYIEKFKIIEFNMDKIMDFWYHEDRLQIEEYKELIMLDLKKKDLKKIKEGDSFMAEFGEKVTKLNESSEFQSWMTAEEDFEWCKKMEHHYGKKEEKIEIARKMLEKKMELSLIAEITGLKEEEIKKIKEELNSEN